MLNISDLLFTGWVCCIHFRIANNHADEVRHGYPMSSPVALNNDFKLCGEIMAMSILQGGPVPNILMPAVANYLLGKPLSTNDVKDKSLKTVVDRLSSAATDDEVKEVTTSDAVLDVLDSIGYMSIPQKETVASVKSIIQWICLKDQLSPCLPSLLQLQCGLDTCSLLKAIKENPDVCEL
ncbi:uncharacterized protein LOC125561131 [Nematostella vectensis]|uniref:uncharacterized protein LOC125561131 n=1 Tax=Nematostella vectensis TaxID=45351 RepID=UPI00207745D0|nr:uncharacterized protein LOC125561131 [Nematostella vectensis]